MTTPNALPTSQLGRRIPSDQELVALIGPALTAACNAGRTFSAYDITRELRQANPNLEIDHPRVRDTVHAAMSAAIAAGVYDAQHGAYIVYTPVLPALTPNTPQQPTQTATAASAPTAATGAAAQLSGLPLLPTSTGQGA